MAGGKGVIDYIMLGQFNFQTKANSNVLPFKLIS